MSGRTLIYVLGRFPEASETFISQEVVSLLEQGVPLQVVSASRRPSAPPDDAAARRAAAATVYPPHRLASEIAAVASTLVAHPVLSGRLVGRNLAWPILRDHSRLRRLVRALHLLRHASGRGPVHFHAHWTLPSEIAMLVARTLGATYSFSVHAHDVYDEGPQLLGRGGRTGLARRVKEARFVLACTEAGRRRLLDLIGPQASSSVITHYHGVDTASLRPLRSGRNGGPPLLVSMGRLVPYKGFDRLIRLLSLASRRGALFRCQIAGDGSLRARLAEQIRAAGLEDRVQLVGWLDRGGVGRLLSSADVFILAADSRQGQHGLPNVLVEAMSAGCATLATTLPAVGELIEDGVNGLLLPEADEEAALLLARVLADADLRHRLGARARDTVMRGFSLDHQTAALGARFREVQERTS